MALPSGITPRGLNDEQAAEYCGVSTKTLLKYGPKPSKIGERNVFDIRVLDAWLNSIASLPIGAQANRSPDPETELLKAIDERKRTSLSSAPAQRRRKSTLVLATSGPQASPVARRPGGTDDRGGAA
jgi:hypothetical protein